MDEAVLGFQCAVDGKDLELHMADSNPHLLIRCLEGQALGAVAVLAGGFHRGFVIHQIRE